MCPKLPALMVYLYKVISLSNSYALLISIFIRLTLCAVRPCVSSCTREWVRPFFPSFLHPILCPSLRACFHLSVGTSAVCPCLSHSRRSSRLDASMYKRAVVSIIEAMFSWSCRSWWPSFGRRFPRRFFVSFFAGMIYKTNTEQLFTKILSWAQWS